MTTIQTILARALVRLARTVSPPGARSHLDDALGALGGGGGPKPTR